MMTHATTEKWCPSCARFRRLCAFRLDANEHIVRDCKDCEEGKRRRRGPVRRTYVKPSNEAAKQIARSAARQHGYDGLDIDAIHYRLRAVQE